MTQVEGHPPHKLCMNLEQIIMIIYYETSYFTKESSSNYDGIVRYKSDVRMKLKSFILCVINVISHTFLHAHYFKHMLILHQVYT